MSTSSNRSGQTSSNGSGQTSYHGSGQTSSNESGQTSSYGSGQTSSNGSGQTSSNESSQTSSNESDQTSSNGFVQTFSNELSHISSNGRGQASSDGPNQACVLLVALYHPTVCIPIPYTNQPLIFGKADFEGFDIDSAQSLGEFSIFSLCFHPTRLILVMLESPQFSFIVFWDEWERVTFALRDLSVSGTYVTFFEPSFTILS